MRDLLCCSGIAVLRLLMRDGRAGVSGGRFDDGAAECLLGSEENGFTYSVLAQNTE